LLALALAAGTPAYAPPERLCGDPRPADPSSDVFSFGVVVAEVFGQFATSMERAEAVMRLMAPPPAAAAPAADLSPSARLARAMLRRDDAQRPSAAEVRREAAEAHAAAASV